MNKKAMFFTLMAMLLISLFVFSLTNPKKNITGIEKLDSQNTRIKSLNDFVSSINSIYIPIIIQTCAYNEFRMISLGERTDFIGDLTNKDNPTNESVYYWFDQLNKSAAKAYHSSVVLDDFKIGPLSNPLQFSINYTVNGEDENLFWEVNRPNSYLEINLEGLVP